MALRDLLVYADASERGKARLRLAAEMARHQKCRLTVLYVKDLTARQAASRKLAELGLVPAGELAKLDQSFIVANEAAAGQVQALLESLREEQPFDAEWRCVAGNPAGVVPQHARAADLCIISQEGVVDEDLPSGLSFAEEMLFATGRPVLFVPAEGVFKTAGHNIVIAWNGSRPAARAVSDALPLLKQASQVTLLTVNPRQFLHREGSLPEDAMSAHLVRHNVPVTVQHVQTHGTSIADCMQSSAHELGADLLVAGAFGHPKLWERLLGGVTQDLLMNMSLPVMMSH